MEEMEDIEGRLVLYEKYDTATPVLFHSKEMMENFMNGVLTQAMTVKNSNLENVRMKNI